MGYKIREAQLQKIPYMLIIGDKEMIEIPVQLYYMLVFTIYILTQLFY